MEKSEIARLLQQIDLEYNAARSALTDPAYGTAQHEFITARMEQLGQCHQALSQCVGTEEAARLLVERLENLG